MQVRRIPERNSFILESIEVFSFSCSGHIGEVDHNTGAIQKYSLTFSKLADVCESIRQARNSPHFRTRCKEDMRRTMIYLS